MIKLENHPCFNPGACSSNGRVHLPVAPKCNLQCKYCNRDFDCVNESRPGVTSQVLTPHQALAYLDKINEKMPMAVVGIAGPGDPFANPSETLETLELVRIKYPEVILCVSTNGLNVLPYIKDLEKLQVSHVTITMNALDAEMGSQFYNWMRIDKRVKRGAEAAAILLERQIQAIKELKEAGIMVKLNTVYVPDYHTDEYLINMSKQAKEWGADLHNLIPIIPVEGTDFSTVTAPDKGDVAALRIQMGKYMKQMNHCQRCRADAAGLVKKDGGIDTAPLLKEAWTGPLTGGEEKTHVAIASREGMMINQHLGESEHLLIFRKERDGYQFQERRKMPTCGGGDTRWLELAEMISDCSHVLVSGMGKHPQSILQKQGIQCLILEGVVYAALQGLFNGEGLEYMIKRNFNCSGGKASGCA